MKSPSKSPTKSLDHFVLLCTDQEGARASYQKLGFHVRPTARHIELGSTNAIIHFRHTYLELICLNEAELALRVAYEPRLECGPGLAHICLKADSLEAERQRLAGLGFTPDPSLSARRKLTMPDGSENETASSSMYNWRTEHRFLSLFYSEHCKPETIFIPEYEKHQNGVIYATRVVFMSDDPAEDLDYFMKSFGGDPERLDETGFSMRGYRGDLTEVMTPAAAIARYGALLTMAGMGSLGGLPVALHFRVKNLEETRKFLLSKKVNFTEFKGQIGLPAKLAVGSVLVFES